MTKKAMSDKTAEKNEQPGAYELLVADITNRLQVLRNDYNEYRDGLWNKATMRQGELIDAARALAEEISNDRDMWVALADAVEAMGIRFQNAPSIQDRIIHAMCGNTKNDKKRASTLCRIARIAKAEKVEIGGTGKWLVRSGGSEHVRLSPDDTKATRKDHIELGKDLAKGDTAHSFTRCDITPAEAGEVLFKGFTKSDGTTELYASVRSDSLMTAFHEQLGRQNWKSHQEAQRAKDTADAQDTLLAEAEARPDEEAA